MNKYISIDIAKKSGYWLYDPVNNKLLTDKIINKKGLLPDYILFTTDECNKITKQYNTWDNPKTILFTESIMRIQGKGGRGMNVENELVTNCLHGIYRTYFFRNSTREFVHQRSWYSKMIGHYFPYENNPKKPIKKKQCLDIFKRFFGNIYSEEITEDQIDAFFVMLYGIYTHNYDNYRKLVETYGTSNRDTGEGYYAKDE